MPPLDRKLTHPPAATSQAAEAEPTVQQVHGTPGVLVVDDDYLVRILVQRRLERDGFDVWLASNGWEAIHRYRTHRDRIAVVLLDVHMPGLDGPATLDALRRLNPEVLVCLMSGDPGDYDPQELLQRGATGIIAKPFQINQLANHLRLLTQGVPAGRLPSAEGC
jgi:two-component system, OmpR family, response regulator